MVLTRSQSELQLKQKIEQLKVKLQNTESKEQFNHLLVKLIRLFGEKTTKENVVMIYRLLVNNHGKELVRTKLCCKQVIFNKPDKCNCGKAFKWGIDNFLADYLFIIEANKCIIKKFNINKMIEKFQNNIVEVTLSPKKSKPILQYLTTHPS